MYFLELRLRFSPTSSGKGGPYKPYVADGMTDYTNYWISCNDKGLNVRWNTPNRNIFNDAEVSKDDLVYLASQVLNGYIEFPWMNIVDKDNPPNGYELVTDLDKSILYWDDDDHKWDIIELSTNGKFYTDIVYAKTIGLKLQLKPIEVTLDMIAKLLNTTVDRIKIVK
jgi:hypothetical protein